MPTPYSLRDGARPLHATAEAPHIDRPVASMRLDIDCQSSPPVRVTSRATVEDTDRLTAAIGAHEGTDR